jgi:hypothetical protein
VTIPRLQAVPSEPDDMMDPSSRPPRKVSIADHIWQAYEDMASQMGSDRDALINQAMFMFARLNGFLDPSGKIAQGPRPVPASGTPPRPPQPRAQPPQLQPAPKPPSRAAEPSMDDDPVRREVQERVLETAAELERLIQNKRGGGNPAHSEPEGDNVDIDESGADASSAPALYMMVEGGELDRIAKDRFVIGRGKHCDFVINSGKVSREHAVISREGSDFFIEDLGSSNGTWFNKQRIKRRKIEDGDEYFICSDKVKFVYR